MSVTAVSLSLLIAQTGIAGILLSRKAKTHARWNLSLYWTVLGQVAVSIVSLAASCVLAAVIATLSGLGEAAFLVLAAALFLVVCAACQFKLISLLADREGNKFLSFWTLRRVGISTASTILVVDISLSMLTFGWYYTEQATLRTKMQVTQTSAYLAAQRQTPCSPGSPKVAPV